MISCIPNQETMSTQYIEFADLRYGRCVREARKVICLAALGIAEIGKDRIDLCWIKACDREIG